MTEESPQAVFVHKNFTTIGRLVDLAESCFFLFTHLTETLGKSFHRKSENATRVQVQLVLG